MEKENVTEIWKKVEEIEINYIYPVKDPSNTIKAEIPVSPEKLSEKIQKMREHPEVELIYLHKDYFNPHQNCSFDVYVKVDKDMSFKKMVSKAREIISGTLSPHLYKDS